MKKSLLLVALAVAMFSCNKEEGAAGSSFKTAYVDTHKLLEESEEMKDFTNKAKVKEGELSRELQQKAKELQLDAASFESEARTKGMQWAQLKQQELQKRQRDLGIMQETFREEFDKEFGVKRDTIVSQMRKFIKDYGKKNGYDYIYGTGEAATVLYAKDGYDITDKLVKELNDKYKSANRGTTEPAKTEEKK